MATCTKWSVSKPLNYITDGKLYFWMGKACPQFPFSPCIHRLSAYLLLGYFYCPAGILGNGHPIIKLFFNRVAFDIYWQRTNLWLKCVHPGYFLFLFLFFFISVNIHKHTRTHLRDPWLFLWKGGVPPLCYLRCEAVRSGYSNEEPHFLGSPGYVQLV